MNIQLRKPKNASAQDASPRPLTEKVCWQNLAVYVAGMLLVSYNFLMGSKDHFVLALYGLMMLGNTFRWYCLLKRIRHGEVIYNKKYEPVSPKATAITVTALAGFFTTFSIVILLSSGPPLVLPLIAKLLWLAGDTVGWCAAWLAWKQAANQRRNVQLQMTLATVAAENVQAPIVLDVPAEAIPAHWWTDTPTREEAQEKVQIYVRR